MNVETFWLYRVEIGWIVFVLSLPLLSLAARYEGAARLSKALAIASVLAVVLTGHRAYAVVVVDTCEKVSDAWWWLCFVCGKCW